MTSVAAQLAVAYRTRPAELPKLPAPTLQQKQQAEQAQTTWMQATLAPLITNTVTTLAQQYRRSLDQAVTARANQNALPNATAAIPDPNSYFDHTFLVKIERAQVIGYIDFVSQAITDYVTNAVPHSNEMNRQATLAKSQLAACKQDAFLGTDSHVCDFGILNKNIVGAVGAKSIKEIAERWSKERTGTAGRLQAVQAWANLAGGVEPTTAGLRRYGSAAEGDHIREKKGFYQKNGVSFERYKWFVDLSVKGGTTSVKDNDKSFWAHLQKGAIESLHGLMQVYTVESVPAVTYKPELGGEVGCFGVHEDVLRQFNTLLIKRIVIRDQQTDKELNPPVVPR